MGITHTNHKRQVTTEKKEGCVLPRRKKDLREISSIQGKMLGAHKSRKYRHGALFYYFMHLHVCLKCFQLKV